MVQKIGWATAQLCHNTVGNCIVTQPVLGVQWVQSVLQYGVAWVRCIAIGGIVLQLRCVVGWELYCNTTNCIMTVVQIWLGDKCVAIHLLYCD